LGNPSRGFVNTKASPTSTLRFICRLKNVLSEYAKNRSNELWLKYKFLKRFRLSLPGPPSCSGTSKIQYWPTQNVSRIPDMNKIGKFLGRDQGRRLTNENYIKLDRVL